MTVVKSASMISRSCVRLHHTCGRFTSETVATTRRYADDRPIGLIADNVGINETFHYRAGNGTVNEIISQWIQRYPPLKGRDPIGGRAGIVPCRL